MGYRDEVMAIDVYEANNLAKAVKIRASEIAARADARIAELERDAARYRYARTLNPRTFESIWMKTICTCAKFDDLIDAARAGNGGEG